MTPQRKRITFLAKKLVIEQKGKQTPEWALFKVTFCIVQNAQWVCHLARECSIRPTE